MIDRLNPYLPYHWKYSDVNLRIQTSLEYHLKNDYKGKINNITYDGIKGALNKALESKYGFKLNQKQLNKVHKLINVQKKNKLRK